MNFRIFQKYVGLCAVLAACGTVLGMGQASAQAAPPATGAAPAFGSVNIEQVLIGSKARQRDVDELNVFLNSLRSVNARLQNVALFLSDAEMRELAAQYEKKEKDLTANDKKRISELEKKGEDRKARFATLENAGAAATDTQKTEYRNLADMRQQGEQNLNNLGEDYKKRLTNREDELLAKTVTEIKGVIAKIAQEKGLSVVFDTKVAVYTANDITADVTKQVNK